MFFLCVICILPHLGIILFFIRLVFFRGSYFSGGVFFFVLSYLVQEHLICVPWLATFGFSLPHWLRADCDHRICISLGWIRNTGGTADVGEKERFNVKTTDKYLGRAVYFYFINFHFPSHSLIFSLLFHLPPCSWLRSGVTKQVLLPLCPLGCGACLAILIAITVPHFFPSSTSNINIIRLGLCLHTPDFGTSVVR